MGLPAADWREYSDWMDAAVRTNNPDASDADREVVDEMRVFLLEAVAQRASTDASGRADVQRHPGRVTDGSRAEPA